MAVTIASPKNLAFLEKIGVPQEYLQKLQEKKIKLQLGFFDLMFATENNVVLSKYHLVKSTDDLMKGKVSDTTLQMIIGGIQSAIEDAVGKVNSGSVGTAEPAKPKSTLDADKSPIPDATMVFAPAAMSSSWPVAALNEAPVKLASAVKMYQPVKGSSAAAVYHMIAVAEGVRIAARVADKKLSLRAEGNFTTKTKMAMIKAGFDDQGQYLSLHVDCVQTTPQRVVGAVLMDLGLTIQTPMPNLEVIKNKGKW